ncbi:MAG: hypothetical protein GY803_30045 [Chloroflexi bacterium]|nr:hypothetical protein [Chloroflexota bacterium]
MLSKLLDTKVIELFYQIPGIATERILSNCLYTIDDAKEVEDIVTRLNPKRLYKATQRKAANWLVFRFAANDCLISDLDQEAGELRVTTEECVREFRISQETLALLNQHIWRARPLYERTYGSNVSEDRYEGLGLDRF